MKHRDLQVGAAFRFADDEDKAVFVKIHSIEPNNSGNIMGGAMMVQGSVYEDSKSSAVTSCEPFWSTLIDDREVVPMIGVYRDADHRQ